MKIAEDYPKNSIVLGRVRRALRQYAPAVIEFSEPAELIILHINGRNERIKRLCEALRAEGRQYAVIQYVLQSTKNPDCADWLPIWQGARLVWSYYDLPALCRAEGLEADFNFYLAPLGVGPEFKAHGLRKKYVMMSSGQSYLSESVREIHRAARQLGKQAIHLGPDMGHPDIFCVNGLDDHALSLFYSQCEFVSGLRRKDGFELPAAEGLLCGARPVLFDRPRYRRWHEPWGIFIPEGPREQVIIELIRLFIQGAEPITTEEYRQARALFDWRRIIEGFWTRLITS